jgi:hypothetical protein
MKCFIRIFAALFLAFSSSHAISDVIASCGSSAGFGYYVNNGVIPADKVGFSEDTISNGVIQLLAKNEDKFDIIHIDATGQRLSIVEDGAQLFPLFNGTNLHIVAIYPAGVVENYTFRIGSNEVTWTKSSFGVLIDKTSVFRSQCLFE